jgi:hypothetical protein
MTEPSVLTGRSGDGDARPELDGELMTVGCAP